MEIQFSLLAALDRFWIAGVRCFVMAGTQPRKDSGDQLLGVIQRVDVGSRGMEEGSTPRPLNAARREAFS